MHEEMHFSLIGGLKILEISFRYFRNEELFEIRDSVIANSQILLCWVKNEQNAILGKTVIDYREKSGEKGKE